MKIFREQDAIGLFTWAVYHDYSPNPDASYAARVNELVGGNRRALACDEGGIGKRRFR